MPLNRFNKLQEEFLAISQRLQHAQTRGEKIRLLHEMQRILQESKQILKEVENLK